MSQKISHLTFRFVLTRPNRGASLRAAVFLLFLAAAAEAAAGSAAAPAVATSSAILDNKFGIELLWSYLISTDSFVHYKEVRAKCAIINQTGKAPCKIKRDSFLQASNFQLTTPGT